MAALTPQVNGFTPPAYASRLENLAPRDLLRFGLAGNGDNSQLAPSAAEIALGLASIQSVADQALQLATKGYVEFELRAQTETTDTVTTFNLSDLGVNFLTPALSATGGASRRVELEAYVHSDAEAALLKRSCLVLHGTTPSVVQTALTRIVDPAGTAAEIGNVGSGGSTIAVGDFWGAATTLILPVIGLEQSANKIRLTFTGVANVDVLWTIRIRVYPPVAQAFPVTD